MKKKKKKEKEKRPALSFNIDEEEEDEDAGSSSRKRSNGDSEGEFGYRRDIMKSDVFLISIQNSARQEGKAFEEPYYRHLFPAGPRSGS